MENQHPDEATHPMSFIDKLIGIFASPGELFEDVRLTGPTNSNWLIPWIIYAAISILMLQLLLNNPSLINQLDTAIREQFNLSMEETIHKGQLTQEQAAQQYEQFAKPGSPWFTMLSVTSTLLGSLVVLFALSFFYMLLGRSAMNASAPYMKVVEVIGLTFFISSLERIVTTMLMFATDSIQATPSLAIFLPEVNLENKLHVALSKINAFTCWDIGVTSVGLSRLFERDLPKVLVLVFALWFLWSAFTLFTGFNLGS